MIKKASIPFTAKKLSSSIEKKLVCFNNAVQRSLVWDDKRKSLLISSMIEGYPIPAFYAKKSESGYDMLDGKQRSNAISDFISDKFPLVDVPEVTLEDGTIVDVNTMLFSELPKELQDEIKDYSLTVYYFDGITDDEVSEMFFRLNNGKPLTAIELTRVKAKSMDKIRELGKHELFQNALTAKALSKYTHEDIIIKSWALISGVENVSFETKFIRPLIESAEITEQQVIDLTLIYNKLFFIYKKIQLVGDKQSLRIAKRMITRTHLLALVTIALDASEEDLEDFILKFFNGSKSATISDVYNSAAASHSASSESVKWRNDEIARKFKNLV